MPVLQFKGKTAIDTYHHTVPHHALQCDEKLSVLEQGKRPALDGNLIVEGDNLLALKSLLPTHAAKIKCIYIDPPYNTGNEGWIYNDNLSQPQFKEWIGQVVGREEEDACRHDKWCCMMYPRLQLLKELLREDGAIFVSIDDNEVQHLRMMMDEIFGADNFLCSFAWQKRYSPPPDTKDIGYVHESILAYRKGPGFKRNLLPLTSEQVSRYKNPDTDPRGPWKAMDYTCRYSKDERPNLYYPIIHPHTKKKVWPDPNRVWAFSQEEHEVNEEENLLWWGKAGKSKVPAKKNFLAGIQKGMMPVSLLSYEDVGHTDEATKELARIIPKAKMNPKPTRLIMHLIQIASDKDSLILDSFAGSGTSGHAVLKLNQQDGGNRKFILVQIPYETKAEQKEKLNICKSITAERVRRVIQGYCYETPKGTKEKVDGVNGSFTYAYLAQEPILGEYRDITKHLPSYEEIAKYIFYTETSTVWEKKRLNKDTNKIGEHHNTSFYLLYTPNQENDQALDLKFLNDVVAKDKCPTVVIYCEKIWIHRSELLDWSAQHKKSIRSMIVPFNLK